MPKKALIECIHGMIGQTCLICSGLTEAQLTEEKDRMRMQRKNRTEYICLEPESNDDLDTDFDYDLEDMNVS